MKLLLLGGTGEARALAARLHPRVQLISSLAGRVPDPALPVGPVRVGGFGGVDGLRNWLCDNGVDAVVDATHPFAAVITGNAATACAQAGIPLLVLSRPPWDASRAQTVGSDTEAAAWVAAQNYSRVFLTTGRSGVQAFRDSAAWFLIRMVTAPDSESLPRRRELLLSRGPYRFDDERALMVRHRIDVVVTKNSGGAMTYAKVQAAQALGVDMVMIGRPALPPGVRVVGDVAQACRWVLSLDSAAE